MVTIHAIFVEIIRDYMINHLLFDIEYVQAVRVRVDLIPFI